MPRRRRGLEEEKKATSLVLTMVVIAGGVAYLVAVGFFNRAQTRAECRLEVTTIEALAAGRIGGRSARPCIATVTTYFLRKSQAQSGDFLNTMILDGCTFLYVADN